MRSSNQKQMNNLAKSFPGFKGTNTPEVPKTATPETLTKMHFWNMYSTMKDMEIKLHTMKFCFLIRDQLCEKQKSIWCQKSQFFHLKQAMTKQELTTTFCTKIMLNAYCVEIDFLTHNLTNNIKQPKIHSWNKVWCLKIPDLPWWSSGTALDSLCLAAY